VLRVLECGACSPCAVVVGVMYMERLMARSPSVELRSDTVEALTAVCFNLAGKFCDDSGPDNAVWASNFSGGMGLRQFNELELEVLFLLGWDLAVGLPEYKRFLSHLLPQEL